MNPASQLRQATLDRANALALFTTRLSRFRRFRGWVRVRRRAHSDCQATLHALAQQRLAGTGRLALQALLQQARKPTWRLRVWDAAIEKKDVWKARGYSWSPGESGRPKCWYRDVSDADKAAELSWLRQDVMEPGQAVWALRITARDRYSDRCWAWGEPLAVAMDRAAGRSEGRWSSAMRADIVRAGPEG